MDDETRKILLDIARNQGTPCFIYFIDTVRRRFDKLSGAFGSRFAISYAVKANPNVSVLKGIRDKATLLDVSSLGEMERACTAGFAMGELTFSGPAKQLSDLERAVQWGIGAVVCESSWEIMQLNRIAADLGKRVSIVIRINPSVVVAQSSHRATEAVSQFGIDQENVDAVLSKMSTWPHVKCDGLHVYAVSNCLNETVIADNFSILIELFLRVSQTHSLRPRMLVFGSGFGIPYLSSQKPLDLMKLAELINPQIDRMRDCDLLINTQLVLEMGRWLVGPAGYLLTSVVNEKHSRGTDIRMCDAGFNNHAAACGMIGMVGPGNWRFIKVNAVPGESIETYLLVGPLCAADDRLAEGIELPRLTRGDLLAIEYSGAYGLTLSPTHFTNHPIPREYIVTDGNGQSRVWN